MWSIEFIRSAELSVSFSQRCYFDSYSETYPLQRTPLRACLYFFSAIAAIIERLVAYAQRL
jgi:hypothetical protein